MFVKILNLVEIFYQLYYTKPRKSKTFFTDFITRLPTLLHSNNNL